MTVVEVDGGEQLKAVTFSANGDYLVSGGEDGVRVWGDGKRLATMATARSVRRVAVSEDSRWIAAGTDWGWVFVWDAHTFEQVFSHAEDHYDVNALDFSPDSTRLVVASKNRTATVWDVVSHRRVVGPLLHRGWVRTAKYSPRGDRIATATRESVRVYDSSDARLLVDINVPVTPWCKNGVLWSGDQLFIASDDIIKQVEASTGSAISEWPVPDAERSYIALPQHGEFIAYSANRTVTFWDTSTCAQLDVVQHSQSIRSFAVSPDARFIAIGGVDGKIMVQCLSRIAEPEIRESWNHDQLASADASLSQAIVDSPTPSHHVLASRALVRTHLGQWDAAIVDAEKSIKIQPSVVGYIAKSMALVGKGERHAGYRACDIAFEHIHSTHNSFLLLVKAIIVFMAGEHDDAISRLDDLIDAFPFDPICYVVQAYLHLLVGNSRMKNGDYKGAIQSFEHARAQMRCHANRSLLVISLISGWKFDDLGIAIRQRLCEALYAAGRVKEGSDAFLNMIRTFGERVYVGAPIAKWVSDFTHRCLSAPESSGDATSMALPHDEAAVFHSTLDSPTLTPLLREWAKSTLAIGEWRDALVAAVGFTVPRFMVYRAVCEHLEMTNCMTNAAECFHQMNSESTGEVNTNDERARWSVDFKQCCAEKLEHLGDAAMATQQYDNAIAQYSVALSLEPAVPQDIFIKRSKVYVAKGLWEDALDDMNHVMALVSLSPWGHENVLMEWAKVELTDGSWRNALKSAGGFKASRFMVHRALCEHLEMVDRMTDAVECFHYMQNELVQDLQGNEEEWIVDFKSRCCGKLEDLGDTAMNTRQYDQAISQYSAALSLNLPAPQDLFIKRSKAFLAKGLWEDALNDANKMIEINPSSPWGYERKHAALHKAGDYENAINAFEEVLSKVSQSSDPNVREHSHRYVNPTQTKAVIRAIIENGIREIPLVLVNTDTGRLLDKSGQASSFESQPIFGKLVSSMTTHIDLARIEQEVAGYYRYATFSHKWEDNEPLFEKVIHITVYDLEESPTHGKLQMFCKIVRDAGFHWAWCDTCCINKADHFVLQEALVSMFKWYQGSAVTIVFLRGTRFPSERGDLAGSVWNTRAWTLQEYQASKVVRFYTEDWTPYMNLDIPNHKESLEIISEMEEATGVSSRTLVALRPGLDDIREKLCLASTRQTTRVEDSAYSLLGIFSISMPVVYGEGDKALGRLLAQLLTSSGDTSILAWSGKSGSFNSCLPANIAVFNGSPMAHIPPAIEGAEMDVISTRLRASSLNLPLATEFYEQLNALPTALFTGQRARIPCVTFKLGPVSTSPSRPDVFRAQTAVLGVVEIRTKEDLARLDSLYLIHPWIDFLLDRQPVGSVAETMAEENADDQYSLVDDVSSFVGPLNVNTTSAVPRRRAARLVARLGRPFGGRWSPTTAQEMGSLRPPSSVSRMDKQMRALRLMARLRQPFGTLLLTPNLGNVAAYRRVASECLITVQVEEITPKTLKKLVDGVRILDVL